MTSDAETISDVCSLVHTGRSDIVKTGMADIPQSILDVGCGWGTYGVLFRCYMDIGHGRPDNQWNRRLDAIEPFEKIHNPIHDYVYNNIWWETAETALDKVGKYDIIFAGNVLEHMDKETAQTIIDKCLEHTNKFFIVATPVQFFNTGEVGGNPWNVHKCLITDDMFPKDITKIKVYPYGHKLIICDKR